MSILILSPWFKPNVGGIETHLEDLTEYLTMRGYRILVITYQPLTHTIARAQYFEEKKNFKLRRLSWPFTRFFYLFEQRFFLKFLYFPKIFLYSLVTLTIHRRQIDAIHAHGLVMAFTATLLSIIFGKKCIASIHAIYGIKFPPLFLKLIFSKISKVLVLSQKAKEELANAGANVSKLEVFTYWIDQSVFRQMDKNECKRILGISGKFTVLFVGRLFAIKGVRTLIKAASYCSSVTFVFVGSGPLDSEIRSASLRQKNIKFMGRLPNRKMALAYNATDVTIVPSLYEEGFGRVILEALACGTPVIASNRGGIPEALDSSVGVLLEPTVQNIIKAINHLEKNRKELFELASNCRKFAEKHFSEKNAKLIEEAYRIRKT